MRVEWPTVGMIALAYGGWLAAGFGLWPVAPWVALPLMAVLAALQSSLVHECLHGHPTRNARVNEALMALPLFLVYPYRRYRATHLAHHADERLTDPLDDPESYYRARWAWEDLAPPLRLILRANNTMLGRVILGPWLAAFGFLASEWRLIRAGNRAVRRAWLLHLPGVAALLALVWAMGMPIWVYLVAVVWPALGLIAIRTYAEHRWHEDPSGRTIIVERSPLAWIVLNNNLHVVHHRHPGVAWYRLPRLYAENREHFRSLNHGYWYPNYWALFREFALRAKEPVPHPALRQQPDEPRRGPRAA